MRLFILRHGQTEANVTGIVQGHKHGILTEHGEWQAARAAERLKDEQFDLIIVSDLRRAKQTAAPIVLTHPEATVIYEPRIRERSHGVFEGTPRGTFTKAAQQASIPLHSFKPQGGESILESRARARTFIDELIATSKGKNVLLVSHGGLITQMLFYLLGEEDTGEHYRRLHPANTALSVFAINDNGKHEVQLLNCVEHL